MDEQLLLLENPLLKMLLLEDERSNWVNPIFYEREKCGEFHTLFQCFCTKHPTVVSVYILKISTSQCQPLFYSKDDLKMQTRQ